MTGVVRAEAMERSSRKIKYLFPDYENIPLRFLRPDTTPSALLIVRLRYYAAEFLAELVRRGYPYFLQHAGQGVL